LACAHRLHIGGDKGIIRKYKNPEAPRSTHKIFIATQKQYWWDAYKKQCTNKHSSLLQLV